MTKLKKLDQKPDNSRQTIRKITYGGILTAIVLIATIAFKFPIPVALKGYVNFGDGVIMAAAMIMGPYAAVSAAFGSALADILTSYVLFAPATFLIKGLMGLFAGYVFKKCPNIKWYATAGVIAICEIIMVSGYFVFETLYYALTNLPNGMAVGALTALAAIPFNAAQGVAAILLGMAIMPVARRLRIDRTDDHHTIDRDNM